MSLPAFSSQSQLFSTAALTGKLFGQTDRYRLFAQKVYPVLVKTRGELERGYCVDNGRVAVEPVLLLAVTWLSTANSATRCFTPRRWSTSASGCSNMI